MAPARSCSSPFTDFCRHANPVINPITSSDPTITISVDRITPCSSCRRAFSRFNILILQIGRQRERDPQRHAAVFVGRRSAGLPAGSVFDDFCGHCRRRSADVKCGDQRRSECLMICGELSRGSLTRSEKGASQPLLASDEQCGRNRFSRARFLRPLESGFSGHLLPLSL